MSIRRVLPLLLALLAGCSFQSGDGEGESASSKAVSKKVESTPVEVLALARGPIARSLAGSGTLRGRREVKVTAERGGLVVERPVDIGAWVAKGAVLARLDDRELQNQIEDSRLAIGEAELAVKDAAGSEALARIARDEQKQVIKKSGLQEMDAAINEQKSKLAFKEAERELKVKQQLRKDSPDALSEADVEKAELAFDQARKEVERSALGRQQAKLDTESARLKLSELEQRLVDAGRATAKAQLALEKAKLATKKAALELDKCVIRAPVAGQLTAVMLEVGGRVTAGMECFEVIDLACFYLDLRMPEAELGVMEVRQPVALVGGQSGLVVGGRVERIDPSVDPQTGTVGVRIRVPDLQGPPQLALIQALVTSRLRRGMFVRAQILVESRPEALLVPQRAIVFDGPKPAVFTVREGKAVRVEVELGFASASSVELITTQLDEGDPIIVAGQRLVEHGSPVQVVTSGDPAGS